MKPPRRAPDVDDDLIIYGSSIGSGAYAVDTDEILGRADQLERVSGEISHARARVVAARMRLLITADLAPGGHTLADRIATIRTRLDAVQQQVRRIAAAIRGAVDRYLAAEEAARARIPSMGAVGERGGPLITALPPAGMPATPLTPILSSFSLLRSVAGDRRLDHDRWAQALRLIPERFEWHEGPFAVPGLPGMLPFAGPFIALGASVADAASSGQQHPGGAYTGLLARTVTRWAFPLYPDPLDHAARLAAFGADPAAGVRLRQLQGPRRMRGVAGGHRLVPAGDVREVVQKIQPLYPGDGGEPGSFQIDKVTSEQGVSWQVFIPGSQGTDGVNPLSWRSNPSAFIGMSGASTQMVLEGLRAAGAKPTEPVLLAGHSQGGMVAVNVANHPQAQRFNIAGVITAGSPISKLAPPAAQTLALEHTEDPIPGVDDASNPVQPNMTTVERTLHTSADPLDRAITNATGSHDLPAYLRTADQVDRADSPELAGMNEVLSQVAPDGAYVQSYYFQGEKH